MQEYKNKNFYLQGMFNCSNELDTYKCLKCGYQTLFKVNLKRHVCAHHVWEHHEIPRTSQKVFNCSSELDKYKCLECDYQTSFKVNLMRHVCSSNQQSVIDLVKTYNCENCDFQTSSYLLLGKHVYYDCKNVISKCDQKLSENFGNSDKSEENVDHFEKEIDKEVKNEVIENELYCGRCSNKTELKRNLRKHTDQEHLTIIREISNILNNKSNNDTHTTKEIRQFKCENCSYQFKEKGNLKKHVLMKHTASEKINWFKCENCSFQSKWKSNLNQHILSKHTASEKVQWFQCENCPFQTKRKCSLKRHILAKHTAPEKIEWFKCENCSFQSKQKCHLKRHIISKHTAPTENITWFKCNYCSFQTQHKRSINKHILRKHDNMLQKNMRLSFRLDI